jgi:pyruvate dehydrogenase E2 component (dihydrolipoamide acetyltransferase)
MTTALSALTMPKWGLTMTEGKVVRWCKQPGDDVAAGDELLEIETSKITNVVEAETGGTLARVVAPEGTTLPIGALLAVVAPAGTAEQEIDRFIAHFVVVEPADSTAMQPAVPEPRMLDIAGHRLRYLELGDAADTPILFLHGFGSDFNSWMFNQTVLADGFRTIALDLPGHGGSTKSVGAGDPTALTDVVETALAALGVEHMHLVGHSMGGAIAALLAARRPESVVTLSLIAPAGIGPEINATFIEGFVRTTRRKEAADVLRLLVYDPTVVSRAMVEDVLRYKRLDGVAPALETISRAWFPAGRQEVNVVAKIAALERPVQAIWGREDQIIPAQHASALGSAAQVHMLARVGHLPHMEKASEVNRLIRQIAGSP